MKKLLILLIVLILVFVRSMLPVDAASLEGLSRPSTFLVKYDKIYVLEIASVYIYSLKDFTLIKKFGKAGEGPKEFKYNARNARPLSMSFYKDQLLVNSEHKVSYFDLEGNYIREKKVPVDRLLFPINDRYLGIGVIFGKDKRQYIGFSMHNKDFKSEKTIFLSDFEMNNPRKLTLPATSFTYNPVYKGKIYINGSSDEFKINVVDIAGKKDYSIKKSYPKLKIPETFKTEALDFFKKSPMFKRNYEFIKKILNIRKIFPTYQGYSNVG